MKENTNKVTPIQEPIEDIDEGVESVVEPKKEGLITKAKGFVAKHKKKLMIGGLIAAFGGAFLLGQNSGDRIYDPPAELFEEIDEDEESEDEESDEDTEE